MYEIIKKEFAKKFLPTGQDYEVVYKTNTGTKIVMDTEVLWKWIEEQLKLFDRIGSQLDYFAEADIRRRYDRICNKIDYWRKRVTKEFSYEQGYEYGLVYAEKQFRNLFKDGEGNELDSESSV